MKQRHAARDDFSTYRIPRKTRSALKTPSVEPVLRSRLLPRISFRVMFVLMTFAAIVAAMARAADNGGNLATACLAAIAFPATIFVAFAVLFLVTWAVAMARRAAGFGAILVAAIVAVMTVAGFEIPMLTQFGTIALILLGGIILLATSKPNDSGENPFAEDQLPPQILPPREQRT